jgi:hypothetical protein
MTVDAAMSGDEAPGAAGVKSADEELTGAVLVLRSAEAAMHATGLGPKLPGAPAVEAAMPRVCRAGPQ